MFERQAVWMIPWSVSGIGQTCGSMVVYDEPVIQLDALNLKLPHRVLFETVDASPEEEMTLLQAVRSMF